MPQRMNKLSTYKTTVVRDFTTGSLSVVYHNTEIVKVDAKGNIILNTGGYKTVTTKRKMNQASRQYELGYSVVQRKGEWFVIDDLNGWGDTKFSEVAFALGKGYGISLGKDALRSRQLLNL